MDCFGERDMSHTDHLTGDLHTVSELAKICRVGVSTIHRWRRERGLPFHKVAGRLVYYWPEVERWLAGQSIDEGKKK